MPPFWAQPTDRTWGNCLNFIRPGGPGQAFCRRASAPTPALPRRVAGFRRAKAVFLSISENKPNRNLGTEDPIYGCTSAPRCARLMNSVSGQAQAHPTVLWPATRGPDNFG